jgi:hypothetical protein
VGGIACRHDLAFRKKRDCVASRHVGREVRRSLAASLYRARACWGPRTESPRLKLDAAARHSGGQGKEPITSVDQLCSELVESAGVLLLPASVYDHGPSLER